jgi:hypothetical protein
MVRELSKLRKLWGFYGVDYKDCSSCDMTPFLLVMDRLCFNVYRMHVTSSKILSNCWRSPFSLAYVPSSVLWNL